MELYSLEPLLIHDHAERADEERDLDEGVPHQTRIVAQRGGFLQGERGGSRGGIEAIEAFSARPRPFQSRELG